MNARGRLAGLTLIIVVLCTLGYALVGQGITLPLIGLLCVGANLLLHGIEGRDQFMLPRWIVVIAAIAVLGWGVSRALGGFKIDALCECVLALMFVKLWDRKNPADYAQILTLAVYLAIGCTVRGDFGPFMVTALCVPAILAATMLFQIFAGQHRFTRHGNRPSQVRWSNISFATFFASGFALIVIISGLVFLFMPRGPMMDAVGLRSSASWVARMGGIGHVSGFSDKVNLGHGGLISESRAIIAEVTVLPTGDDGKTLPVDTLHLRGAVLEHYEKGAWRQRETSSHQNRDVEADEMKPNVSKATGGIAHKASAAREVRIRVVMRDVDRVIPVFAPWWPAVVEFASADRLSLDRHTMLMRREGPEGSFAYTVTSYLGASADPRAAEARKSGDRSKVSFPSQIVTDITRDVLTKSLVEPDPAKRPPSDDARAARVIEGYLRREFKYTLDLLAAPSGVDPIEWFLTTSKKGHCEYFASAMVAMCRSAGIPARLVTGYVAAEASMTGSFVVRQSNAHAWVEAAVDGFPPEEGVPGEAADPLRWHSWRTFDPTPPADFLRIHQPEPTVSLRFGKMLSSLESLWTSNILRFDDRRQSSVLGSQGTTNWVETKLTRLSTFFGDELSTTKDRLLKWGGFTFTLVMGGLLLAWGSERLSRRWRVRRHDRGVGGGKTTGLQPQVAMIRDKYVRAMERGNFGRVPQEPLLSHLDRCYEGLRAASPALPGEALTMVNLLYRGQFGDGLSEVQLQEAHAVCKRIERLLTSEKSSPRQQDSL